MACQPGPIGKDLRKIRTGTSFGLTANLAHAFLMSETINIRRLAELAGCSKTAVSMALRNHPRISIAQRERIQKLAIEHGYARNPVVSTLMNHLRSGRSSRTREKLGMLVWSSERQDLKKLGSPDLFAEQLNAGLRNRAAELGYELEVFRAYERGMTGALLSRVLYTRGVRGIILGSMRRARGHASLRWDYFAAATMTYTILKPSLHRAIPSLSHGMTLAMRNLRRLGYRKIGYINLVKTEDMVNEAWLAANLAYQFRIKRRLGIPPLLLNDWCSKQIAAWLEKYEVDVVLSNWADPLLKILKDLGYRVPADIGFASLDTLPGRIDIAGVHQQRDIAAAMAVDLVVEQLEMNRLGLPKHPKTVLVDGTWNDGPTLTNHKV